MIYAGIDLSLTSPGITILQKDKIRFYFFAFKKKHLDIDMEWKNISLKSIDYFKKEWKHRIERFNYITDNIIEIFSTMPDEIKIGIEGYAFGAQGQALTGLAELRGILLHKIFSRWKNIKEIPPTTIKKYFEGKGTANKSSMYLQFKSMGILDIEKELDDDGEGNPISDIVDSFAIALYLRGDKLKNSNIVKNLLNDLTV